MPIKSSHERSIKTNVMAMLYGVAGIGKTTLALSAGGPTLLIDFDCGNSRVNAQHMDGVDTFEILNDPNNPQAAWAEIEQAMAENVFARYNTIVVDTVGKMLDYITSFVCGNRQPQLKQWGEINGKFKQFTAHLRRLGKNVIFVAHAKNIGTEKAYYRPDIREKNYNEIITELDLLGFMQCKTVGGVNTRTITFDPTDENDGKNCCYLPAVMSLPHIIINGRCIDDNTFIATQVIAPYQNIQRERMEEMKQYNALVDTIRQDIDAVTDAETANAFVANIGSIKHIGSSLKLAKSLFAAKISELGLTLNKETKKYE